MHVCFLCNEYPPDPHGGIGSVTRTLARSLARRGHHVTVLGYTVGGHPGVSDDDGVRVMRLPHAEIRGTGLVVNGWRLGRALLELDTQQSIDIIEGPENSLAAIPKRLRTPAVIRMHGGHHFFAVTLGAKPRQQRRWIERRSFARATHLCAVSHFVASTTLELLKQTQRPVEILPNPVDTTAFAPRAARDEQDGLIVFAGTVCEKKGVRQLVQAMPTIVNAIPHARLSIIGRDSRDPFSGSSYTEGLRRAVPEGLRDRIHFAGSVSHTEMPWRLAQAAVCVYPSHMEAMPVAWLEAMSMAKCVVASRSGPGAEVIEHSVSGLLCDPHDPGAIAEQVILALSSVDRRHQLGEQARARVLAHFSEHVMIERNERFYERCQRDRCA